VGRRRLVSYDGRQSDLGSTRQQRKLQRRLRAHSELRSSTKKPARAAQVVLYGECMRPIEECEEMVDCFHIDRAHSLALAFGWVARSASQHHQKFNEQKLPDCPMYRVG
jgi:hypothetical protein